MKALCFFYSIFFLVACSDDKSNGKNTRNLFDDLKPEARTEDSDDSVETPRVPEEPTTPLVSCKKFCSNKNHFLSIIDDGYSYLTFANFSTNRIGRCRGHALLTQKMNILARFAPDLKRCDLSSDKCLKKHLTGIERIHNYKTHIFEGFRNLKELSEVDSLRTYMKNIVSNTSHRYSALDAPVFDRSYSTLQLNYFYEVQRRVLVGEKPYIGVKGRKTGSHALLAYKVKWQKQGEVVCVRDSNVVPGGIEDCLNYIYVDGKSVYYKKRNTTPDFMKTFKVTTDEDKRVVRYKEALQNECIKESELEGLCSKR